MAPAAAPLRAGEVIANIVVEGNQRIEIKTIKSYLALEPGDVFDDSAIDNSLKKLFETGLFADVAIKRKNNDLLVLVRENPVINKVAFEGNKRIDDEELEKEIQLRPRMVYTRTMVQGDVKRLLEIYQRNGRFSAKVEPKVIQQAQNRVALVFEVDEGAVTKVKKIGFVGNEVFDGDKLEKVIRTEKERWYKFFSSDDTYDPDRLLYDQELLRRFYVSHGYADFQVTSAVAELTPEKDGFYITFSLNEGPFYSFGKVGVSSQISDISADDLSSLVVTKEGETFNADQVEETVDDITTKLGDLGYAFVDISPAMDRDEAGKTIGVTYEIKEGPRVYVERVNITGNVRTVDEVIRREFRLSEGDPYSTSKLQRSEQRIKNLGFFQNVKITNRPGSAPDRTVIDVDVTEQSTGELTFGAGYSTVDGALADISLRENNLLGKGKMLKLDLMAATRRQDITLGYTEPYFMGRDVSAGFDVFKTSQDLQRESSYDHEATGLTLRSNYGLSEHLRHAVNYTLRTDEVTNIDPSTSLFIRRQQGEYTTSQIGHSLTYDRRDNRFNTEDGYYLYFGQDLAGAGGDARFLRNEFKSGYFYSIRPQWVLQLVGKAGYMFGLGQDVRINNRFFKGSNDIRGFDNAGIGPRDTATGDALGGNIYYAGTVELSFPLGLPSDVGIKGSLFSDFGSLWNSDDSGPGVVDDSSPRLSVGAGLAWASPVGPIRIDIGQAIVKETYDDTQQIKFSFGTRF
ncbi:MAG: outer membrane protein assembly factor BamA [Alphaproteobacteria bacterium]|nr:outer membrane protein assembly factor BamA [Alphaproteobacteria bacterium]